jgi:predicted membrane-bound spermidine synthase
MSRRSPEYWDMLRAMLMIAFLLSGAAGLIYELAWSRYLALFVGHSAEAQVLVIAMFLGGMSIGALAVGERSRRLERPLFWYAIAEGLLGAFGLAFHFLFDLVTRAAYTSVFPALGGPVAISIVKWLLAGLLIFVPSIVLGTTFPLIAAAILRRFRERPGGTIATLYFVNSLGGAIAILVAGFVLIGLAGLRGTLATAAALNFAAAALAAWIAARHAEGGATAALEPARATATVAAAEGAAGAVRAASTEVRRRLWTVLLGVSALTAVASFVYEIGWIRMLSLVMGSATHSFELMLSAFILGLALGALAIRTAADRATRPVALLGGIQWLMGLFALATLPVYAASFGWLADLMSGVSADDAGYRLFNLGRYGVALAVMLPSTVLAGMTLPLITNTLLRVGSGERAIGWVYACNTAGAIVGVMLAGLVLLPWLGLKGMLVWGAGLDMALGVGLLALSRRGSDLDAVAGERVGALRRVPAWAAPATGIAALGISLAVVFGIRFDRALLTSGVFRYGRVDPASHSVMYYADGRTATVGVHITGSDTLIVLTSNGKPDASLTARWVRAASEPVDPLPIRQQDESTQMLSALVTLAHAPDARTGAVIGHGSGMSGHFLLSDPGLEALTTIEIEPRVIDASYVYYPANRRVFDDARSRMVIADAKSFFAHRGERYDLILSEPSNPWVSGTASLFSLEFYDQIRSYLAPDGVFGQWFHLYESDDDLVLSVLSALHRGFADYRAYLVGDTDLMIVATPEGTLREPDWDLLLRSDLRQELSHVLPILPDHLDGLRVFGRRELAPLTETWESPNSDYRPILDLSAERARFLDSIADGAYGMAKDRFRIAAALGGWRMAPARSPGLPIPGLAPLRGRAIAVEIRRGLSDPDAEAAGFARVQVRTTRLGFGRLLDAPSDPADTGAWAGWVADFLRIEGALHAGTAGFVDEVFYGAVGAILARSHPPPEVQATVDFMHGLAGWQFDEAARAARVLMRVLGSGPEVEDGEIPTSATMLAPLDRGLLLDGAVVAFLVTGEPGLAAETLDRLADGTGRPPNDLRLRLLRAHIAETLAAR